MQFIDQTIIQVIAGRGGNGIVSFSSAKGKPKLGADGGDGGTGGNVILCGNRQLNTLSALRYKKLFRAEDGGRGGPNRRRGATGDDLLIEVPLGTIATDSVTGESMGEVVSDGQHLLVAKGGRHGLGNTHWLSPTHQAPQEFRPGMPGEERELKLELKLLADIGLAGFPNAGKSTLLSRVSGARPKIADYPFTTLVPQLGVLEFPGDYSQPSGVGVVMADIPGLIEGASAGRGLGHDFLRHLERTSHICYVIDPLDPEREPLAALATLRQELVAYSPELATKPSLVVMNKVDLMDDEAIAKVRAALAADGSEVHTISAMQGEGLTELKYRLLALVTKTREQQFVGTAQGTGAHAVWELGG